MSPPSHTPEKSEFRHDPISGRWVVLAPERAKRPLGLSHVKPQGRVNVERDVCPFCPGMEDTTPAEVYVVDNLLSAERANVPTDPRFRLTLRIYGLNQGEEFVNVSFHDRKLQVPLQPGRDRFTPSYAEVTDFRPLGIEQPREMTVLVEVPHSDTTAPATPIWAFITVTNNLTQHITTITPQQ